MVCDRSGICATRDIWEELKKKTDSILESVTIEDLVERQKQKIKAKKPMYYI
jgi:DNA-binding IscR family transcriptional regulator